MDFACEILVQSSQNMQIQIWNQISLSGMLERFRSFLSIRTFSVQICSIDLWSSPRFSSWSNPVFTCLQNIISFFYIYIYIYAAVHACNIVKARSWYITGFCVLYACTYFSSSLMKIICLYICVCLCWGVYHWSGPLHSCISERQSRGTSKKKHSYLNSRGKKKT